MPQRKISEDADSDDDISVIGTVFDDDENSYLQNRAQRQQNSQEVRDSEGRRRFHGAFTGGFSAGFFNTCGSAEGWTPAPFVSSRTRKADIKTSKPEDFMDEDELNDTVEAGKTLLARDDFDTFGTAAELEKRNQLKRAKPDSTTALSELIIPSQESIGIRLLKVMGWIEGTPIGAHKPSYMSTIDCKPVKKIYGCMLPLARCADDSTSLKGFHIARRPGEVSKTWSGPSLPKDFQPFHRFDDTKIKLATKVAKILQSIVGTSSYTYKAPQIMTAEKRSSLLGEERLPGPDLPSPASSAPNSAVIPEAHRHEMSSALASYFTVGETQDLLKPQIPMETYFVPEPEKEVKAASKQPEISEESVECSKRTIQVWVPEKLLCKRFNLPYPFSATAQTGTQSQLRYAELVKATTLPSAKPVLAIKSDPSEIQAKVKVTPVSRLEEIEDTQAETKPPVDLFKAIFEASSDEDEEENEEEEVQQHNLHDQLISSSSSSTTSSLPPKVEAVVADIQRRLEQRASSSQSKQSPPSTQPSSLQQLRHHSSLKSRRSRWDSVLPPSPSSVVLSPSRSVETKHMSVETKPITTMSNPPELSSVITPPASPPALIPQPHILDLVKQVKAIRKKKRDKMKHKHKKHKHKHKKHKHREPHP